MVKYTRENVEGIIFQYGNDIYRIISSLPKMHLKEVTRYNSTWENKNYSNPNDIVRNLNNGVLFKVIEQPNKIYELW